MKRPRTTIQPDDLTKGALIRSSKSGRIYRLGPPKKRNVNLNVVNHCQLYSRDGKLLNDNGWYNMTNLRNAGFKYHGPIPSSALLITQPQIDASQSEIPSNQH